MLFLDNKTEQTDSWPYLEHDQSWDMIMFDYKCVNKLQTIKETQGLLITYLTSRWVVWADYYLIYGYEINQNKK